MPTRNPVQWVVSPHHKKQRSSLLWVGVLCLCALVGIAGYELALQKPATVSDLSVLAGFSPDGTAQDIVLQSIEDAQESILMAGYVFTSKPITEALRQAALRGVDVRVVVDAKASRSKHSMVSALVEHGVPVRVNDRYAILHHKFMVIDQKHLETGSFNYSAAAATKNAENVLLLRHVPELASAYTAEWIKLWDGGQEYAPLTSSSK